MPFRHIFCSTIKTKIQNPHKTATLTGYLKTVWPAFVWGACMRSGRRPVLEVLGWFLASFGRCWVPEASGRPPEAPGKPEGLPSPSALLQGPSSGEPADRGEHTDRGWLYFCFFVWGGEES